MGLKPTRNDRRLLKKANAKLPGKLVEVTAEEFAHLNKPPGLVRVLRSNEYLVQVYQEANDVLRLSVIRSELDPDAKHDKFEWVDGITWDTLQRLKREAGYGDRYGLEVFPRDCDLVNIANLRHLWLLPKPLNLGWFAGDDKSRTPQP